jgi:MerR family Zn(II)-responsive transcriptional regulator of zntA
MKIGDLAERSGISAHTLRYYEKTGLFSASQRSESNYRIYSQDDLTTAKLITSTKITDITQQITQLKQMQKTLQQLERYCCGGQESAEFCSIIAALEQE